MSYQPQPAFVTEITDDWLAKSGFYLGYYRIHSKVAHLMLPVGWIGDDPPALCRQGSGPFRAEPYGTGTQDEYEKARALPLCRRCAGPALIKPNP